MSPTAVMLFWMKFIAHTAEHDTDLQLRIPAETWAVWESEVKRAATKAFHAAKAPEIISKH